MTGRVRALHALLPVTFQSTNLPDVSAEFVIDSGFTGQLSLAPADVATLGLTYEYPTFAQLADGTSIVVAVHVATILWIGTPRRVRVLATGERPLLGTALLADCDLFVQFREGGMVTVT